MTENGRQGEEFMSGDKKSFTLIELLVVIAIISILASMLMPALHKAREEARKSTCLSNLRQIYLALSMYTDDYSESYPYASGSPKWDEVDPDDGTYSWMQQLYPYVKNKNLYRCPSLKDDYGYFLGTRAAYIEAYKRASVKRNRIQYPSLFVLAGDTSFPFGNEPDKDDYSQNCVTASGGDCSVHNGGQNILFADGHAKWYREYNASEMTFRYSSVSAW